jgi:hypothetical protein
MKSILFKDESGVMNSSHLGTLIGLWVARRHFL